MIRLALAALVVASVACSKPAAQVDAGTIAGAPLAVGGVTGPWALTEPKLDAWLRYVKGVAVDAGSLSVSERARLDVSVRQAVQLSDEELERIETMVAALVTTRTLANLTGAEAVKQLERATQSSLAKAGKDGGTKSMERVTKALAESRAAQPVADVDGELTRQLGAESAACLLKREAEVVQAWAELAR